MKIFYSASLSLAILILSIGFFSSCKTESAPKGKKVESEQKLSKSETENNSEEKAHATVSLRGAMTVNSNGLMPEIGAEAPNSCFANTELKDVCLADYKGKRILLNVFPSIDTDVCARSVRQFNEDAASLDNTVVLCISKDLPFAQKRFCAAEGIGNVETLSVFRNDGFEKDYGLLMVDGPMQGLLLRAVIVVDETGKIKYKELVSDVSHEPNYQAAIAALKK